jgi:transposase
MRVGKAYWTIAHVKWLKALDLEGILQETLNEYLITYEYSVGKIERLDQRIEELGMRRKVSGKDKKAWMLHGDKAAYGAVAAV